MSITTNHRGILCNQIIKNFSITTGHRGRLCNQIIRNLALSLLAKKYDLYVEYSNFDDINNKLGIKLFIGKQKYNKTKLIYNSDYIEHFNNYLKIDYNLNMMLDYFQSEEVTTILHNHLKLNMTDIIDKNPYKDRYKNNNDLFLHIRLTDRKKYNPGLDYFVSCINNLKYDNIYIGSDDFNDDLIKQIKTLYPHAILFQKNKIKTIQFGSTCKNIILSHGTFSAVIGYLAFFSNIYFTNYDPRGGEPLDIFLNKGWNPVNLEDKRYDLHVEYSGDPIIRNLALSLLAKKYDLYAEYSDFDNLNNKLGIKLFIGEQKYNKTKLIYNSDYIEHFNNYLKIDYNLNMMHDYFQSEEITTILHNHLKLNMANIIDKNPYKDRYKNNNDLFLHIRLTDAKRFNVGLDYYVSCINNLKYDNIYIDNDNFNDDLIKQIKTLYPNVILFQENKIKTIQFGSTCKNIILSHGSFSAVVGYLAFFSNIYFPDYEARWCQFGMFLNKGWNPVNLEDKR